MIVLGGSASLLEPDRLTAAAGSAEAGMRPRATTPPRYPVGDEGSTVVRRIYLTLRWEAGLSLTATPLVDGVEIVGARQKIIRSGAGRETVFLALMALGSVVQVAFESDAPTGRYWIEKAVVMHAPASGARGRVAAG